MFTTQLGQEVVVNGSRCQDCGNQAKKDCTYSRCRSCCKNKGFECQTHIRSTWIPVDRRRQRILEQQQQPPPTTSNLHHTPKRHKQNNPFPSLEELKFPAVMSSMATFSCVRVRSMDETVNEVAYQTSVKIGGHVFSGLLYDQGPDHHEQSFNNATRGTEISSISPLDQQQHNLNLFTRDGATATMAPLSSHELLYPPPPHPLANSFRPGMPYFSHPKP